MATYFVLSHVISDRNIGLVGMSPEGCTYLVYSLLFLHLFYLFLEELYLFLLRLYPEICGLFRVISMLLVSIYLIMRQFYNMLIKNIWDWIVVPIGIVFTLANY